MSRLYPSKLHITFKDLLENKPFTLPRKYTLTHSDRTGELFLTIAEDYDFEQISHWYTRFMRDEVFAEWIKNNGDFELHIYTHISGGFIFGWAGMRDKIIRSHLKLVFQTIRYGDRELFSKNPKMDEAFIIVHFKSKRKKFNKIEKFKKLKDYKI